jgi:hypothetical protein
MYQNPLGLTSVNDNVAQWEPMQLNKTSTQLDGPPPIYSGDVHVQFPNQGATESDHTDFYPVVQQARPWPMTIVGLFPSYEVEEWQ